jgi:diguanylate cyclase
VSKEWLIELGLRDRTAAELHGLGAALRPIVDRALGALAEAIEAGEGGDEREEALREVGRGRQLLLDESDPLRIQAIGDEVLTTCEASLRTIARARVTRQSEITALIGLVREAVATIAGSNRSFDANLDRTTARFEAMTQCADLHELKERLAAEITVLKHITVERQKGWAKTVAAFEGRVAELEQQLVETRIEASLDPLTRIANRRTFDRICRHWLETGRSQFAVALLDLDNFKRINDTHGHSIGDKVLLAVAQALKGAVRSSDLVARLGGDEFGILATGVTLRQAEGRLKAVSTQLAKASLLPGERDGVTVSCGVAEYSAGDTIDSLLHRADQALYDAKRLGKNRVSTRTPSFIRDLLGA